MDFDFNDDQKMFKNSLIRLLDEEIVPIVDERDKKGPLTRQEAIDFNKKFMKLGMGWNSEGIKTIGQDPIKFGIFTEELSRVWLSLDLVYTVNFSQILVLLAPDEIREKLMPRMEAGELIFCNGITEPGAGSDHRGMKTTAVLDGNKYIVNGSKTWISNAPIADVCLLVAKEKSGNITFLLVDKEESPFETGKELHKLGLNAGSTGELFFDNCIVPKENNIMEMIPEMLSSGRLDEFKKKFPMLANTGIGNLFEMMSPISAIFCFSRTWMALAATGVCQAALGASITYAKNTIKSGRPVGKNQFIHKIIYDMIALTETSRLLAYRALDLFMKGRPESRLMSSLAKGYASEAAVRVASNAIDIRGAMGLSVDLPLERYLRDARSWTIPDGTTEIQKLVVGKEALGMKAYI